MNRGDHRERIFITNGDRTCFLRTLGGACARTGWQVHAYCLMSNHFHLVLETPSPNLARGMQWLLGTYTSRFNRKHRLCGHLFSGRYKALIVDGSGSGYLRAVSDYVHLNPGRAQLLRDDEPLKRYAWSSFPAYLRKSALRPAWLRVDRVLGEHGIFRDCPKARHDFERAMERLRHSKTTEAAFAEVRTGWFLGAPGSREQLLDKLGPVSTDHHHGPEVREAAEQFAERVVASCLHDIGWNEADLKAARKGDGRKVRIAIRLRCETTVTWKWISARLHMGAWRTARNAVVALDAGNRRSSPQG